MVRYTRKSKAMVGGKRGFKMLVGSRAQVMNGTAYKTGYGKVKGNGGNALTRKNLKYNKNGRIVSVAKSSKKGKLLAQLKKAGYTYKKGHFGAVKIGAKGKGSSSRTRRCRHKSGPKKGKYKKCRTRRHR